MRVGHPPIMTVAGAARTTVVTMSAWESLGIDGAQVAARSIRFHGTECLQDGGFRKRAR
jgi:hypothetical protein